ncbi:MAG: tetratricopeptide repeat protein [Phycisphaerae bacterium]|nr:tetratricopeptide repeat protein [Phycisphaerae bacterium]
MPRTTGAIALALGTWLLLSGCVKPPSAQTAVDHFVRGKILMDAGDIETALAELGAAVKIDPELSIAHSTIGDIHRRQGNWELARGAYEDACRTNPFAFRAHYNLGVTYQALAAAAQAAEAVKDYLTKAVEVYLRAIMLRPGDFDSHLNISACYFQLGYAAEAERYCQTALQIDPNSAMAHANLGTIHQSQGNLDEAIQAYKASLELDANQPDVLMCLGSAYVRQREFNAALETYTEAVTQAPTDSGPWEKTGACYFYLRDFAKAQDAYAQALSLNPLSAAAHRGLGVAYMAQFILDRHRTDLRDKGLEAWQTSLSIRPDQEDLIHLVQKYSTTLGRP